MLGVQITGVEYGKLRSGIKFVIGKYKPSWELRGLAKPVSGWISPIKRGSNKFRYIMSGRGSRNIPKF